MRKLLLPLLFFTAFFIQLSAQKKNDFGIIIPDIKIGDSKFNNLQYIESRPNPDDMGIVYSGMIRGEQFVVLSEPLDSQFQSLIKTITIQPNETKTMAVQMRTLFFRLGTGDFRGKGMCNLRMSLYEMDSNGKYYFMNTIDTLLVNSNKEIMAATSDAIVSFIVNNLTYSAYEDEQALDIEQVMDIDIYERNSIPFYTESLIPDGIYNNYKSLMALIPDSTPEMTVTKRDGDEIREVKIPDPEKPGKNKKLKEKEVYAIVIDGVTYISFEGDFRKAYKKDGDWRIPIIQKVAGSGFSLGISVGGSGRNVGGGVGIGIPVGGKKKTVEVFIDHLNGDFY